MAEYFKNKIGIISRIGGRETNEDSAGHIETDRGDLIVVCDGVGGTSCGEIASKIGVNVIIDEYKNGDQNLSIKESLIRGVQRANSIIREEQRYRKECRHMATTVVCVHVSDDHLTVVHAGDSRLYQIRSGRIIFVTTDHSVVQKMVNDKMIKPKEAFGHPRSNEIYNCLGLTEYADISITERKVKKADILLLTSDGIHDILSPKQLLKNIYASATITNAVQAVSTLADLKGKKLKNKRHDNLTLAIYSQGNEIKKQNWLSLFLWSAILIFAVATTFFIDFNKDHNSFNSIINTEKEKHCFSEGPIPFIDLAQLLKTSPNGCICTSQEYRNNIELIIRTDSIFDNKLSITMPMSVDMDSIYLFKETIVDTISNGTNQILLKYKTKTDE